MNKKVLVLPFSTRKEGNSDLLCDKFINGSGETGYLTENCIFLGKNILENIVNKTPGYIILQK